MLLKSISSHREWEQLATEQFDPWQVGPRQVFTPHSHLSISCALVVVGRVDCLGVTGVMRTINFVAGASSILNALLIP